MSGREENNSPASTTEIPDSVARTTKALPRSGGRRTHRACDRCRVKKSKCNGQQPCNTCKANERTCVFSALRRRDIRKWHCHMQDTVEEAIQRLYRACRDSASFPGTLPEEKDGFVTTESILHGMGFTNLDIGPRAGGLQASIPSQVLPARSPYASISVNTHFSTPQLSCPESQTYQRTHSDSGSIDSRRSDSLPSHHHGDTNASPIIPGPHPQHLPTMPSHMSDQFPEVVNGQETDHSPYHYHHHHQGHYPMQFSQPEQSQFVTANDLMLPPTHVFSRSVGGYEYPGQYPSLPYPFCEIDPHINAQLDWPGQQEIAAAGQ